MAAKAAITCPHDGAVMEKKTASGITIDHCPSCQGVWLDKGELESLRERAAEEGDGFATGFIVGMLF